MDESRVCDSLHVADGMQHMGAKGCREFLGAQNIRGFSTRNTAMKSVVILTLPKLKSTDKV